MINFPTISFGKRALTPRTENLSSWLDRVFTDPFGDNLTEIFQKGLVPPVNLLETEKAFVVTLEVPGLEEKDINVEVMGNQLVVRGEKKFEEEKKGKEWLRVESQYGAFTRTITLPNNLKYEAVEASLKKGVLTLTFPKVEPTPTTKVRIKAD